MKILVFLSICMCISKTVAVSTEVKTKMTPKANSIQLPQKMEMVYSQPSQAPQTEYVPMQLMQKHLFVPQHQPQPAMIIIAQPALVPHNVIYGGHPIGLQQQLLNYFHTNPQAKYQFLYGGYQPHPTAQTLIQQTPIASPSIATYQVVQNPVLQGYNHLIAAPSQVSYAAPSQVSYAAPSQVSYAAPSQVSYAAPNVAAAAPAAVPQIQNHIGAQYVQQQHQPMQLQQLAHYAQMTAQQFGVPLKNLPPIVTGLENFTPEQQAQIKAQLGAHIQAPATASTVPTTTAQYSQQVSTQPSQSSDYMQSTDKSNPQPSGSSYSPSLVYRTQYTKG